MVDHSRLAEIDDRIAGLLDDIDPLVDPCDASERVPLVLLPVRLETKFAKDGRRTVLKVRIYPDEVHVDALVRGLTPEEIAAGRSYWTAVWADPVPEGAWDTLVAAAGATGPSGSRTSTTPANLADRSSRPCPTSRPRGAHARNIVARALPDRFVVMADQGGRRSSATGRPIPTRPSDVAGAARGRPAGTGRRRVDRAAGIGVAGRLRRRPRSRHGGHRAARGRRRDRRAPRRDRHARASAPPPRPTSSRTCSSDTASAPRSGCRAGSADQQRRERTVAVPRSSDADRTATRAVTATPGAMPRRWRSNSASPPTWSLHSRGRHRRAVRRPRRQHGVVEPGVGHVSRPARHSGRARGRRRERESARRLFRDHVRGRGVAPTIHVGAQPYGVMPVSDLTAGCPRAATPPPASSPWCAVVPTLARRGRRPGPQGDAGAWPASTSTMLFRSSGRAR